MEEVAGAEEHEKVLLDGDEPVVAHLRKKKQMGEEVRSWQRQEEELLFWGY